MHDCVSFIMMMVHMSASHVSDSLPVSASDREQLKIELQQVNQQISQQTRGMEVHLKCPFKFMTRKSARLRLHGLMYPA